ncbi:hypothetical protein [Nocardia sp. NBC_01388]|uniref:hypothetical protein n=1 Tax=Nocardia sp. NBC_01388 TaxID=2903596 RepID=UPI002F9119E8
MDFDPSEQSNPNAPERPSGRERARAAVTHWCPVVASGLDLVAGVLILFNSDSLAAVARLSAVALRALNGFAGPSRE